MPRPSWDLKRKTSTTCPYKVHNDDKDVDDDDDDDEDDD
jgi:hypothetical protein